MKYEFTTNVENQLKEIIKDIKSKLNNEGIEELKRKSKKKRITENNFLEILSEVIAYSNNVSSTHVDNVLKRKVWKKAFCNFKYEDLYNINPFDIIEKYWKTQKTDSTCSSEKLTISGIQNRVKVFYIIDAARTLRKKKQENKRFSIIKELRLNKIPRELKSVKDIQHFWQEFYKVKNLLKKLHMPYLQSSTSLLHFLLHLGYDCIKPDSVVKNVCKEKLKLKKLNEDELIQQLQMFCVKFKIKPQELDLILLIEGGQRNAIKYVMQ